VTTLRMCHFWTCFLQVCVPLLSARLLQLLLVELHLVCHDCCNRSGSTVIESLPISTKLDDNFTVPVTAVVLGLALMPQ